VKKQEEKEEMDWKEYKKLCDKFGFKRKGLTIEYIKQIKEKEEINEKRKQKDNGSIVR